MALRLDYVAGVSPAKWLRAWAEQHPELPLEALRVGEPAQLERLRAGEADLAFVRLPVDAEGLHLIPLWEEVAVAVLEKGHPLAEAGSLSLADLAHEPAAPVQPGDPAMTLELVAAGTGYAIVPHSIARLHHRRDVVAVPVDDAPPTRIALVWRVERDDETIQDFVGVVRGRTARSSRRTEAQDDSADPSAGRATKPGGKAGTGSASKQAARPSAKGPGRRGRGSGGGKHQGRGRRR